MRYEIIALALLSALISAGCNAPASDKTEEKRHDTIRIADLIFIGDLMQHTPQVQAARTDTGFDYMPCFRHLRPTLDSACAVIVNLETTLSYTGRYTGYPMFGSPPQLAANMHSSGMDIAVLANNHICDRAGAGIDHTIAALDSAGIAHTGAFSDSTDYAANNPLFFEASGIRFALLNYTYGTNGLPIPEGRIVNIIDITRIGSDIETAQALGADCIIVFYHWGEEYSTVPSQRQRELAHWSKARGADIIIGSHPHVLQPIEYFIRQDSSLCGAVYYSLGNFVSNQRKRYCDGGIIARVTVTKRGDSLEYEFGHTPVWVSTPVIDHRARHTVLPHWIADTMLKDTGQIRAYELFMKDSEKILGKARKSVFPPE